MTSKVKGFVKAMSQNKFGYWSACVANDPKESGTWVGLSSKTPEFKGIEIKKGLTVEVEYDENNFNNASAIQVVEKSGGGNKGGGKKGGYSRDNSGMEAGHCINAAYALTDNKKINVIDDAKRLHEITVSVKEQHAKNTNRNVDDYDVGASAGHAVLNACRYISGKKDKGIDDVEELSMKILKNISDPILEHIREGKKSPKKEAPKDDLPEDDYIADEPANSDEDDDFEDDLPF